MNTGQAIVLAIVLYLGTIAALAGGASGFRRGRHHVHAPLLARPFERTRPTVQQIGARIAREQKLVPVGSSYVYMDIDFDGFPMDDLARVLADVDCTLGRGLSDHHAGIAG